MSMQKIIEEFDKKFCYPFIKDDYSLNIEIKKFLTQAITEALNETVIEEIEAVNPIITTDVWNSARLKQIELINKFIEN